MGLTLVDRSERRPHDRLRVVTAVFERRSHVAPRCGDPTHRGFITLGPVTRPDDVLGHPLQRLGYLDTHQVAAALIPLEMASSCACKESATTTTLSPIRVNTALNP